MTERNMPDTPEIPPGSPRRPAEPITPGAAGTLPVEPPVIHPTDLNPIPENAEDPLLPNAELGTDSPASHPPGEPREPEPAGQHEVSDVIAAMPDAQRQGMRDLASKNTPESLAARMIHEGLPEDDARSFLQALYPDKPPGEINTIIQGAVLSAPPSAEEARAEEVEITPDKAEALVSDPDAIRLAHEAERMYTDPGSVTDKDKKTWLEGVGEVFGGTTGKTILKVLKYTTIATGVFGFILILLLSIHSPKGK